jgi:undecaprenyl-phosphate 4-deoxy-4-formamido-L-arabinose transferase
MFMKSAGWRLASTGLAVILVRAGWIADPRLREGYLQHSTEAIELSLVMPVFNEEDCLDELYRRLSSMVATMPPLTCEILFVDDGSSDGSGAIIDTLAARDLRVRRVTFARNRGQFPALLEGLREARGRHVITLDADLQNPPEEIPRLVEALESGYDLVTTRRRRRLDPLHRRVASRISNRISSWIVGSDIPDHGCMLCGFHGDLARRIATSPSSDRVQYLHALALAHAKHTIRLDVAHAERFGGKSRYGIVGLLRLQVDAARAFRHVRGEVRARESSS